MNNYVLTLIFLLLFYLITIALFNRLLIHKGIKRSVFEEQNSDISNPMLYAGNLAIIIIAFFSFKSIVNYIVSASLEQGSWFFVLSLSALVLIVNAVILSVAYVLSTAICNFLIKYKSKILMAIVFVVVSSILTLLLNEIYILITTNNAYTIF